MVDCSIEHLINIVLKGMSSTPMRISQHQHFHFIPRGVLRVCAVPDECFPIFSAEVSEGTVTVKLVKVDMSNLSN